MSSTACPVLPRLTHSAADDGRGFWEIGEETAVLPGQREGRRRFEISLPSYFSKDVVFDIVVPSSSICVRSCLSSPGPTNQCALTGFLCLEETSCGGDIGPISVRGYM